MKLELTFSDSGAKIPAYVPAYEGLYRKIVDGKLKPNEQLGAETALAAEYGISRGSLRQALAILREDGLIYNIQGKGNFVCKNIEKKPAIVNTLENPIFSCAINDITQVHLFYSYQPLATIVLEKLQLTPQDIGLVCNAIYYQDTIPVAHAFYAIPVKHLNIPGLDLNDKEQIKDLVAMKIYEISASSTARICISEAEEYIANYLNVPTDTPLIFLEEILYGAQGDPMILCKYYLLPEYYQLQVIRR